MNGRMPCRVTDDPLYDRADWEEGTGAYAPRYEPDPDYEMERMRDEELARERKKRDSD